MKLTFKDLKQAKFTIEVEPSDTIAEVKDKVQESQGYESAHQRLIYSGKILADDKTVEDYKIQEKDFVVCMSSKPKPAVTSKAPATPTLTTPAPSVSSPPAPQPGSVPNPSDIPMTDTSTTNPSTPAAVQVTPAGPAAFGDPNAFSTGGARESAILALVELGYERPEVERAMRAAFNNPDRAAEYLLTGIPANVQEHTPAARPVAQQTAQQRSQETPSATSNEPQTSTPQPALPNTPINLFEAAAQQAAAQRNTAGRTATGAGSGASTGGVPTGSGNLDFLRNSSQFAQIRNLIQEQPGLLEPILQSIAQGNPQLAAAINQNPEAFLSMLQGGEGDEGDEMGRILPPNVVHITEEENAAIARLEALGFPRERAFEAYMVCGKDETAAANYLFDHGYDSDDEGPGPA